MKPIDVTALSTAGIRNLLENHRKRRETGTPLYVVALGELERRTGGGLNFDKSFEIIREAAASGQCIRYKDLAEASGASWAKVHYEIGGHLWRLIEYADRRGWPMLSAIVVNKSNVASGARRPSFARSKRKSSSGGGLPKARDRSWNLSAALQSARPFELTLVECGMRPGYPDPALPTAGVGAVGKDDALHRPGRRPAPSLRRDPIRHGRIRPSYMGADRTLERRQKNQSR